MTDEAPKTTCERCKKLVPVTLMGLDELCVYCQADDQERLPTPNTQEVTPDQPKTPEELAREELAMRILTRKRMLPFVERFNPDYQAGWVHKDICKRLEKFSQDVVDKKSPRLMLFMPPRHGKSTLASVSFPAWHLGRNPDH